MKVLSITNFNYKNVYSQNFQALSRQNPKLEQNSENIDKYDTIGRPFQASGYYNTNVYEFFRLLDESEEEAKTQAAQKNTPDNLVYEDRTQYVDVYECNVGRLVGMIPITKAEWSQYISNKAQMSRKTIAYIEETLSRYDLKHLIK